MEGESYVSNVALVRVLSSKMVGIEGVQISVYDGQWQYDLGSTGSNGQWINFGIQRAQYSFTANVSGSTQQINRSITTDRFTTFRTAVVNVELLDLMGKAVEGRLG